MFDFREELKKLPDSPGVYLMHDAHDDIIYVGKAINLHKRVGAYFRKSTQHTAKIKKMISLIARFEYIVTDSELEALILECNLIKEHNPKYNTMLKDDKAYPYIRVTVQEDFPRIMFSRTMKRDKSRYFGPFTSVGAVRDTIGFLQKVYCIRSCNRNLPKETGKARPCMYYHIGQCNAPCNNMVSKEEYRENVNKALQFLNGDHKKIISDIEARMTAAADRLDFEKAAEYRDLIDSVNRTAESQKITDSAMDDRDIIAFASEKDDAVVQVFFIRGGRIIGREHFHMTGTSGMSGSGILTSFVKQYYVGTPFVPGEITLAEEIEEKDIIAEWLSGRKGRKVNIFVPRRGKKEKLIELAERNAQLVLSKDAERIKREEAKTIGSVNSLSELLDIPQIIRIEAFDISNTSGYENVGSMIVYEKGKPKKNAYRKFKIRSFTGADDYRAMKEVLTRRFAHGLEEREAMDVKKQPYELGSFSVFPELIMMDGGKGQVNIALEVLKELNIDIPVCGMVKDDNHNTRGLYYKNTELPIDRRSETFKLITRIQDEAHRFAVEYHRSLRGKTQVKSLLDDIPCIGKVRRKALLRAFGAVEAIANADIESIKSVDGMDAKSACSVYNFFKDKYRS